MRLSRLVTVMFALFLCAGLVPAYTHGGPDKMTAYLDFGDRLAGGGYPLSDDEVYTIFYRVAEYLYPSLGITVTTVPPTTRPGDYITVRILGTPYVPWRRTAIGTAGQRMFRNTSWYTENIVWVGSDPHWPEKTAVVAAHEVVHKLQPDEAGHEETPVEGAYQGRNLMSASAQPGARLSPAMALVVAAHIDELRAGWRVGAFLPPQGGQWRFDRHNIGD